MIYEILGIGEENAIKGKDLVVLLGLPDIRTLQGIVEQERREDKPIVASPRGYYLPKNREELEKQERRYTSMGKNILRTARTFRRRLNMTEGQYRIIYKDRNDRSEGKL